MTSTTVGTAAVWAEKAKTRQACFTARLVGEHVETSGDTVFAAGYQVGSDTGKPNGVFANWRWDGNRLTAQVDRVGAFPLFYHQSPDAIAISPTIVSLLEHGVPGDLDYDAIASLFHLTTCLECETPFTQIKALPPSGVLQWERGRLLVSRGEESCSASFLDRSRAIDAYVDLFAQAIRRRLALARESVLPLSGGRDSRHILFELVRQGCPPRYAMTIDYVHGSEVAVAREVARAVGVPHRVVQVPRSWLSAERIKNRLTHFCSLELAFVVPALNIDDLSNSALWDGLAGDVLSAGHFLDETRLGLFRAGRFDELAEVMTSQGASSLFVPAARAKVSRERVLHRLSAILPRYADYPNPVAAFSLANRTRRGAALTPFSMFTSAHHVFAPYVDSDVLDFLLSLPGEMFLDHTFHTEAIHRAFPDLADLPFRTYPGPDTWRRTYVNQAASLLPPLLRSQSGLLARRNALGRAIRCVVDPRYTTNVLWLGPLANYLLQICELASMSPNEDC